jgi:hypothetical protein
MLRILTLFLTMVIGATWVFAQSHDGQGANLPPSCSFGATFVKSGAGAGPYWCSAPNVWTSLAGSGSGSGLAAGEIIIKLSGACSTGFEEATELNGRTLIGTLAANGDVGTTGGSDSITQVLQHTHMVTVTDPGHAHAMNVGATDDTSAPFDRADAGTNASGAQATTATGGNFTGVTAATANPAGSVASIDNRSAFIKVLFCRKL